MTRLTWDDGERPLWPMPRGLGWLRAGHRGLRIAGWVFGLLPLVIALRLAGAGGAAQRVVSFASRRSLAVLGLKLEVQGTPDPAARAFVANHSGWPDIFTLSAAHPVNFVSKSEVARWPGIGLVARGTGTLFIERRGSQAAAQRDAIAARIAAGDRLLFFPEGTSTDNRRVLPFRPSLFAAFFDPAFQGHKVQPVSVIYTAPEGTDPRLYAWWGDMDFAPHFLTVLGLPRQGKVEVVFHPALDPHGHGDRKALARAAEEQVRAGLESRIGRTA